MVDFLPTESVAVLAMVAKPLREAQSCLLITAIRRRGKTAVPNPTTTRALLDALLVGEPQHFCETWERGMEQWRRHHSLPSQAAYVGRPDGGAACLRLVDSLGGHKGVFHAFSGENLLVTRLRVTMRPVECDVNGAVGYVMLCGPGAATDDEISAHILPDFMGSPTFHRDHGGPITLAWLQANPGVGNNIGIPLVEEAECKWYTVDARIHRDSTVDVSVDGQTILQGVAFKHRPLSWLHLYNYSGGISRIGELEVWYERAAPNQVWGRAP